MKRKLLSLLIGITILTSAAGCSKESSVSKTKESEADGSETGETAAELDISDMFTDRDREIGYDKDECIRITCENNTAAGNSEAVTISGSTITITQEGTYLISGSLSDGQIIVDAPKTAKLQLILSELSVNCNTSAALYIRQADKVFVTLAPDTVNSLSNQEDYIAIDDNNIDAAVFSREDITFNGQGTLNINAAYGHGIVSKDDLIFTGGTYMITAAEHGLAGKDSVRIADGSFDISSGSDCIHASNKDDASSGFIYIANGDYNLTAGTDGMDAAYVLQIDDGDFNITTGGGSQNASTTQSGEFNKGWGKWGPDPAEAETDTKETSSSAKGLKADNSLFIRGGNYTIDSSDDSVHSNANVSVSGGNLILSSGDDGIHADAAADITGGTINIQKSYEGIEGSTVTISGGAVSLVASDDGLNAAGGNDQSSMNGRPGKNEFAADDNCGITISGGTLNIDAGGDGIDSNGSLYVSGGDIFVAGPENSGNGALDYNGDAQITGGTILATGESGMAQNFGSSSTQGSILAASSAQQTAGSTITLLDSSGKTLITHVSEKQYNSVVISCPEIVKGETYTLQIGSETQTITMDDLIFGTGGMGNPGGMNRGDKGDFQKPNRNGTDDDFPNKERPEKPQDGQVPDGKPPELPQNGQMPDGEPPELPQNGQMPDSAPSDIA